MTTLKKIQKLVGQDVKVDPTSIETIEAVLELLDEQGRIGFPESRGSRSRIRSEEPQTEDPRAREVFRHL